MTYKIKLVRQGGKWVSIHQDPAIYKLFGSNRIETPYSDTIPGHQVLSAIQSLNPEYAVELIDSR